MKQRGEEERRGEEEGSGWRRGERGRGGEGRGGEGRGGEERRGGEEEDGGEEAANFGFVSWVSLWIECFAAACRRNEPPAGREEEAELVTVKRELIHGLCSFCQQSLQLRREAWLQTHLKI